MGNTENRQRVIEEINRKGFIENFETRFKRKDQTWITGLLSAKLFTLKNEPHIISIIRDITELKKKEDELREVISKLRKASEKIKTLERIIPICSNCKKIRDDKGFWEQVEAYVSRHSEAEFSHSICPDCFKTIYPEYYDEDDE